MSFSDKLSGVIHTIPAIDLVAAEQAKKELKRLTKPVGSLGVLEDIVVQLAGITGQAKPRIGRKDVVVMCGDHGIVDEGVSAFPQEVTQLMMVNFINAGAAVNVLARQVGAEVTVVDIGSKAAEVPENVINRKVKAGTNNFAKGPAMSREEAAQAILVGIETAQELAKKGSNVIALGEMGIGNTTPSAAITSVLLGRPLEEGLVGRGSGINDKSLLIKREAIQRGIEVNKPQSDDALDVLAKVGGLEIAGMAGVTLGAALSRIPVLLDGVIASAAALVAARLQPAIIPYLMATHLSVEPAHQYILEDLGIRPSLHLNMRLGEGTGATLFMPMMDSACRVLQEMATYSDLGLPDPE
ncbi:nicotinate-nucleotide--dimethylbenzimidazole phosphoribosyltransferase [Brevibacillus laterosporus]|uniref:nicotinate-nucleotide--dimethylbenzimidazole phosphoribosyltransferase n=1 Tax=Brevibacillus TaxID=55080 RepID=UPI001B19F065|nr:nicotinate-nucleotide--dimethylbenzimidazole phosphoribosyltransferase [Brevibacillus halotolerans]GIO01845.1 nicotinate-nucleotide--dimethylbenzimidazole phosphoribosyltransferase [Brevibacillus halotolerans]